jgi:hypothetical protein
VPAISLINKQHVSFGWRNRREIESVLGQDINEGIASGWSSTIPASKHTIAGFAPTPGHPDVVAFVSYFSFDVGHLVYSPPKSSQTRSRNFTRQQSRPCRAAPEPCTRSTRNRVLAVVAILLVPGDCRRHRGMQWPNAMPSPKPQNA